MFSVISNLLGTLPILTLFLVIGIIVLFCFSYIKAKPDEAVIISGLRPKPRIVIGRAAIKLPFLERVDRLQLGLLKIDVKTQQPVKNHEFIDVRVDAVATVRVSVDEACIKSAMINFLNQDTAYISRVITDVLEGNIREIIGQLTLHQMVQDTKAFAEKVQENAVQDMLRMGLEVVSFNVQHFDDKDGILEALGAENTTKITKEASIVKADGEKEIAVAQAEANRVANAARIASEQEIAIKDNELAIKKSELKIAADAMQAEADAAYEIQKETQRQQIERTTAEADLVRATKSAEVKKEEVIVAQQILAADVEARAKADRVRTQEEAEAAAFKAAREADALRAMADARRYETEELAEGIKATALAEAEGIRAKGLAEAEATSAKAEAMQKYGEAAVMEMYFQILPSVAAALAKPLENIGSITMYGEGNTSGMVGDITKSMNQVMHGVNEGLGIDIKSVLAGVLGGHLAQSHGAPTHPIAQESLDMGATPSGAVPEATTENLYSDNF